MFDVAVLVASVLAGALAAVTGFGIGSLLTPLLALQSTRGWPWRRCQCRTSWALRLWLRSGDVDRRVFWSFGLTSAAGGLAGALLQGWASSRWLTLLFGGLLLFAAASELTGLTSAMRFKGHVAWIAGALSGVSLEDWLAIKAGCARRRFWGSASQKGASSPQRPR